MRLVNEREQALCNVYFALVRANAEHALVDLVNTMTHDERINCRAYLGLCDDCKSKLVQNLFYDYKTQVWIGA